MSMTNTRHHPPCSSASTALAPTRASVKATASNIWKRPTVGHTSVLRITAKPARKAQPSKRPQHHRTKRQAPTFSRHRVPISVLPHHLLAVVASLIPSMAPSLRLRITAHSLPWTHLSWQPTTYSHPSIPTSVGMTLILDSLPLVGLRTVQVHTSSPGMRDQRPTHQPLDRSKLPWKKTLSLPRTSIGVI